MLRVRSERDTAMRAGLALFFLMGKVRHSELAENLIRTLPRIISFYERHKPPFIAKVYRPDQKDPGRPGRVKLILSRENWHSIGLT